MPGNPATTPRLKLPRYAGTDPADYPSQTNAIVDLLDPLSGLGGVPLVTQTLTSQPILEVGAVGQIRAGRQLALADFTALGLSAPRGLWNLSDLTDVSGNGRTLSNKNAVTFATGINGNAATAAQFRGASGTPANDPALYISDTGAADPFRISTGSWGCWFRTAKRGVAQNLMGKNGLSGNNGYFMQVGTTNAINLGCSLDSTTFVSQFGVSDVADDRWHFAVACWDGTTLRGYVDGVLEVSLGGNGVIFASTAAWNIGALSADGATAAGNPHFGRIDEAFVTVDVLTEDQIRALYAARLTHTLGAQPKTVSLNVRRQRRGAALATTDFSTTPLRLYSFTGGSAADQGSNGVTLTATNVTSGVAGPDGTPNAVHFSGTGNLAATDAGLPSGLLSRSYGCWFKGSSAGTSRGIVSWPGENLYIQAAGALNSDSGADAIAGPYVADGQWHFAVVVEDNTASDGVKRKLYLDGRLVAGSTAMNAVALAGANRFRIGAISDGTLPFTGQIDGVFVCGYAMTTDEVLRLYAKGGQALAASPKNAGDHVEGVDSASVLFIGDTLDAPHSIDLTLS